jgi:hypothetical protein
MKPGAIIAPPRWPHDGGVDAIIWPARFDVKFGFIAYLFVSWWKPKICTWVRRDIPVPSYFSKWALQDNVGTRRPWGHNTRQRHRRLLPPGGLLKDRCMARMGSLGSPTFGKLRSPRMTQDTWSVVHSWKSKHTEPIWNGDHQASVNLRGQGFAQTWYESVTAL